MAKPMALRLSVHACLLALASLSMGAVHAAPPTEWEQPEVVAVNREPMKATFFNFESREKAIAADPAASKYYLSLDGTWIVFQPARSKPSR